MKKILRFSIEEDEAEKKDNETLPERLATALLDGQSLSLDLMLLPEGDTCTVEVQPSGIYRSAGTGSLEAIAKITKSDRYPAGTTVNVTSTTIGDVTMHIAKLLA